MVISEDTKRILAMSPALGVGYNLNSIESRVRRMTYATRCVCVSGSYFYSHDELCTFCKNQKQVKEFETDGF